MGDASILGMRAGDDVGEGVAGATFEQDEESAVPGDDAVHPPIAKALPEEDSRRAFRDAPVVGAGFVAAGRWRRRLSGNTMTLCTFPKGA